MAKYQLKYGKGVTEVEIPQEEVIGVIEPNHFEPEFPDPEKIIRHALANPIGTPPLDQIVSPGEKVCVTVNDITRLTKSEVFVPIIIEELNKAGIPDKDITILFANGLHKAMTEAEMQRIIGTDIYERVNIVQHDGVNSDFTLVGTTSRGNKVYVNKVVTDSDRVILTGGIILHHLAGYGGGRKNIIPGVAHQETIFFNHRMMVDPRAEAGNIKANPIHEDVMEACGMVAPDFLFNVIMDHQGEIAAAVAGHWREAHAAGCDIADQLYKVPIGELADIVIASGGGYPKDIDLRQSKKGYYHAARAVKPGGTIIAVVACEEGISREGDPFAQWLKAYRTLAEVREAMLKQFDIGGLNAYRTREVQDRARLVLVTELDRQMMADLGVETYGIDQLQQVVDEARAAAGDKPAIYLMPQAGLTLPSFCED
ncbi:MAG: nickel-dependent lactate racemase [bacterium]|jgi:nickel-dependent lactate racemase